ncbi:hypothetical protein AVEN_26266-1 [Araneus ventricosus]|uniref:Uncharacterized protein n=1 Tax=Araneus ventricosus TaxID=182803 RepID=A0A4Y2ALR2_ARAVE|nr:hypothetical protein AVEN_26266-1 [Araneus ventricosus]
MYIELHMGYLTMTAKEVGPILVNSLVVIFILECVVLSEIIGASKDSYREEMGATALKKTHSHSFRIFLRPYVIFDKERYPVVLCHCRLERR